MQLIGQFEADITDVRHQAMRRDIFPSHMGLVQELYLETRFQEAPMLPAKNKR